MEATTNGRLVRFSFPDLDLTADELSRFDIHDQQCIDWYVVNEELRWWYNAFTNAGSYPPSQAMEADFFEWTNRYRAAVQKAQRARLSSGIRPQRHCPTSR